MKLKQIALLAVSVIALQAGASSQDVEAYCKANKYSNDPHFASVDKDTLKAMDEAYLQACIATMNEVAKWN